MHHSDNVNTFRINNPIHDAISLKDNFAQLLAACFGYFASALWIHLKPVNSMHNLLHKVLRVNARKIESPWL